MRNILITGANGFLGYYLVQQLTKKNYFVIATGKGECRLPFNTSNFVYAPLDFVNDEEVKAVLNEYSPEIIIHAGAMSKPDECELNREAAFRTNVTGTINLLNHASLLQSFFLYVSTDFVFNGQKGMYNEEDDTSPVNYYGETKLLAEEAVKKYPFRWSIVRTVMVYGKPVSGRQNILTNTANALQKGERLKIFNDQVRTPTYVEDLASGIVTMVDMEAQGIYHLSGEDVFSPYEMAIAVANHLNLDGSLITEVTEKEFEQPARRPLKTGLDISKAKRDLDYQPTRFDEGLKKTFVR